MSLSRVFRTVALAFLAAAVLASPAFARVKSARGNVTAVDWNVMQIAIKGVDGKINTFLVAQDAGVKFTDTPEAFPRPGLKDVVPPMYVWFDFEDYEGKQPGLIQLIDVHDMPASMRLGRSGTGSNATGSTGNDRRGRSGTDSNATGSTGNDRRGQSGTDSNTTGSTGNDRRGQSRTDSNATGSTGNDRQERVRIQSLNTRSGEFKADVAGRSQTFRATSGSLLRSFREGDLVVITLQRRNGQDVVTDIQRSNSRQ